MKYAKIENNVVVYIDYETKQDGFIEVPNDVYPGFILQEDGTLVAPPIPPRPYQDLRVEEYPPIGDQLDAILKFFDKLPRTEMPEDLAAILFQWKAVKEKYPKNLK